ncbi:methionine--tRNA ligase [Prosthecochloris sp.]|uniref:methionine--tRNA ligase n=1 Tax=Prosthecochloris sp. TaxID=290513 RepID=UPI0025E7B2E6|nr:methionine--tRNA ligase [Prosthecochloris sp.]
MNNHYKRTLVTTALPYANGPVHLGHLAGVYLPADIYVRYKRLQGEDIVHIGGSDEHGVPITITADKEDISPQDVVDRYHSMNLDAFERCGISFDFYGRTSSKGHFRTAQEFFREIDSKDIFVKKKERHFFDPQTKRFLSDRYVTGTCPICGYAEANGDQCEQCGTHLSPRELIDPRSKLSDEVPELRETLHWYFPLGRFQGQLENYVERHTGDWRTNVLNYTATWLKQGLADRAITRDLHWGVPVPIDNDEATGKVLYVWFDAVLGYISFTREWSENRGTPELWREYWQNSDCRIIHFIGKDNVVFHTLMFPAILMAWNEGRNEGVYSLADNVPASEFMNFEGRKFSKSRNYAVYLGEFLDKFPADTLRYTIAMNYPENKDSDFSWQDFQNRTNGELADTLGNFIKRSIDFTNAKFNGEIPYECTEEDWRSLGIDWEDCFDRIEKAYEDFHIRDIASLTMQIARAANRFLTDSEPWKVLKTDPDAAARTMALSVNLCYTLAIAWYPVIPHTANRIYAMLGFSETLDDALKNGSASWDTAKYPQLKRGHNLSEQSEILFRKVEDKDIASELEKIEGLLAEIEKKEAAEKESTRFKPEISFDDFLDVDLRVATVMACERVKKADKLLKLQLKVGSQNRQVLAGIAQSYSPESVIGKNVILVANLAERKIRGELSQGMILAVEGNDGKMNLVEVSGSEINGKNVQ